MGYGSSYRPENPPTVTDRSPATSQSSSTTGPPTDRTLPNNATCAAPPSTCCNQVIARQSPDTKQTVSDRCARDDPGLASSASHRSTLHHFG